MFRPLPLLSALLFLALGKTLSVATAPPPTPAKPAAFGVAAHGDVNIEWWYVNAHVTTQAGHHYALIGSFFQFGNGKSPFDQAAPAPRAHYLIYAVTDLDTKTQRPYSLGDSAMVAYLKQIAPFLAVQSPRDTGAQALLAALNRGTLPPPHQQFPGRASVVSRPFRLAYGTDTLTADNANNTAFTLDLGANRRDKIHLTLQSQKPAMAVGGKGETGLKRANDMYYFSLTRCAVGGSIDTGAGAETITHGSGWFDHQWGNSWVASNNGWDWWGVQLTDGTDILFFRQRDLKTGKIFFPLATFMDNNGHQTVTKNIVFTPDKSSVWTSPRTGVLYPLAWTVAFPDHNLRLRITTKVSDQEMPILGPGSGIWEGACDVAAQRLIGPHNGWNPLPRVNGTAYMELVGYGSPAVKAQTAKRAAKAK